MEIEKVEHASGGKGYILKKKLLSATELKDKVGMFAEITLKPGCSLGYHVHSDTQKHIISFPERENMTTTEKSGPLNQETLLTHQMVRVTAWKTKVRMI